MRIFVKILLGVYYILLILTLLIQLIAISADFNSSAFDPQVLLIINFSLSVILIVFGVDSLRKKHRHWFPESILLIFIMGYILWVLGCYVFLKDANLGLNNLVLPFSIPMIPNLIHLLWFYINFEKETFNSDLNNLEFDQFKNYKEIFNLDLPFVKVLENKEEHIKVRLTMPFGIGQIFLSLFVFLWVSAWIFGMVAIALEDFNLVLIPLLMIPIFILYFTIKNIFLTIIVTITPSFVTIKTLPFLKEVTIKDLSKVKLKELRGRRGVIVAYYLIDSNTNKKFKIAGIPANEMGSIFFKLLDIYSNNTCNRKLFALINNR